MVYFVLDIFISKFCGIPNVDYQKVLNNFESYRMTCPPQKEGRKEMFYLTMHSTHFIYDYMASHIW